MPGAPSSVLAPRAETAQDGRLSDHLRLRQRECEPVSNVDEARVKLGKMWQGTHSNGQMRQGLGNMCQAGGL